MLRTYLGTRGGRSQPGLAFGIFAIAAFSFGFAFSDAFAQGVSQWQGEFPKTDFETRVIETFGDR